MVKISKKDFIKEHKHLIKVLKYGKKKDLKKEEIKQLKELNKYLK